MNTRACSNTCAPTIEIGVFPQKAIFRTPGSFTCCLGRWTAGTKHVAGARSRIICYGVRSYRPSCRCADWRLKIMEVNDEASFGSHPYWVDGGRNSFDVGVGISMPSPQCQRSIDLGLWHLFQPGAEICTAPLSRGGRRRLSYRLLSVSGVFAALADSSDPRRAKSKPTR